MVKPELNQVMDAATSAVLFQRDGTMYRMDHSDDDSFTCTLEDTGDQITVFYDEVSATDTFYRASPVMWDTSGRSKIDRLEAAYDAGSKGQCVSRMSRVICDGKTYATGMQPADAAFVVLAHSLAIPLLRLYEAVNEEVDEDGDLRTMDMGMILRAMKEIRNV